MKERGGEGGWGARAPGSTNLLQGGLHRALLISDQSASHLGIRRMNARRVSTLDIGAAATNFTTRVAPPGF